jgi:hypothetical protein
VLIPTVLVIKEDFELLLEKMAEAGLDESLSSLV